LAAGDAATAIEKLAVAAALQPRSAEAHESLARALRDAGKIEAARQAVLVAQERGCTTPDLLRLLSELPPPPPCRGNFEKGQVLYSSLTGNRWTVLDRKIGGFGAVYKVRDHENGRIHALKTFQARFLWSDADRKRFIREASTWIRLDPHPNIVSAEWIETIEDFPCVVQEFVEGGDVADMLATQILTIQRVLELAIQFCDGMGFAHNLLGVVHRDIKSSNCLLTSAGSLKIGDFGLARTFEESRTSALDLIGIDPSTRIQFTVPMGTWSYMAPEQLDPEATLDTRTDIHAFGVMLYEMLTRDLPAYYSQDETDQGLQRGWLAYEYISLSVDRFRVSKDLWRVVLACVEHNPADRPSSFEAVRDELSRILRKRHHREVRLPSLPVPVGADYWNNKAVSFHALQRHEEALQYYERALLLDLQDGDLWQNKGAVLVSLKRFEEAIESLNRAASLSPADSDVWNNMGLAHLELRQLDSALGCFRKAAHLSPRDPLVCKNFAEVLCEQGQVEEAMEWITKGLGNDDRNPALLELKGFALLALRQPQQASECFDDALKIAPRRFGLWKGKALAHERLRQFGEVLDACDRALELMPGDGELLTLKANAVAPAPTGAAPPVVGEAADV
jgi:serine/threonine protein kinase